MTPSSDKTLEAFPHTTIHLIIEQHNYESISEVRLKLNVNAESVQSHGSNGQLGLMFLTVNPEAHNTLSNAEFKPPANPGVNPNIPANSAAAQISSISRTHQQRSDEFFCYDQTDKAPKSQLIAAADDTRIRALRHECIGHANVATLQMLTHLCDTCARITEHDLNENDKCLKAQYDPNLPFKNLIDQVEDAIEHAAAGAAPCAPEQIVNAACTLEFDTGVFADDCKEWRMKEPGEKTWDDFKIFFTKAHQDLQDSQVTARALGHQANNVSEQHFNAAIAHEAETLEALANLAAASAADKSVITTLTSTSAELVKELV